MNNYLITGANSYLGREFVKQLSKNNDNVLLVTSRTFYDFSNIQSNNIKYLPGIDLLDENDLLSLQKEAETLFKGKFNLINCTGYYEGQKPFIFTSLNEAKKIFDSNYTTVYNTVNTLMPLMIQKGGGHIIAFSCNSVRFNYPEMAPFTAAKSALESLMRTLANELYECGVFANSFQLATLLTEHETKVKPFGDHQNWLKVGEVVAYIEQFITDAVQIHNGNSIQLYHYSDSFFHKSYYERIKH